MILPLEAGNDPVLLVGLLVISIAQWFVLLYCAYRFGVLHERISWLHEHCTMMAKKLSEKKDEEKK